MPYGSFYDDKFRKTILALSTSSRMIYKKTKTKFVPVYQYKRMGNKHLSVVFSKTSVNRSVDIRANDSIQSIEIRFHFDHRKDGRAGERERDRKAERVRER